MAPRFVKLSLLLTLCLSGITIVTGMSDVWVELRAPRFVVHRHSAVLRCEHNVDPDSLYKVVFFKHGQRIMKYVRGRDPPFETFNFTGAEINLIKLTPTSITLEKMDFSASGSYACEIALETPLYSKVSKIHELNVIVRQKYRPKIKIKHKKLSSSENLEATCQSAPAHPAPHLTWFINHMKVDERLIEPHGTWNVHRHHHGMPLSLTNSSLHFPLSSLQLFPNQTVEITCLSTIPSYANLGEGFADLQNHTVTGRNWETTVYYCKCGGPNSLLAILMATCACFPWWLNQSYSETRVVRFCTTAVSLSRYPDNLYYCKPPVPRWDATLM